MWLQELERRADRDDACRIDVRVSDVVMALDVIEIHGLGDARLLIEIHEVVLKVFVVYDPSNIAFEVPVVDRIKSNERTKEPPIRLHDLSTEEEPSRGEALIQFVESGEESSAGFFVGRLSGRKTRLVDPVVH